MKNLLPTSNTPIRPSFERIARVIGTLVLRLLILMVLILAALPVAVLPIGTLVPAQNQPVQ